jgi:phospholipid-binding lipoprotein MlaA
VHSPGAWAQTSANRYQTMAGHYRAQPAALDDTGSQQKVRQRRQQTQRMVAALSSLAIAAIAREPGRRAEFTAAAVNAAPEHRAAIARAIAAAYPGFAADIAGAAGVGLAHQAPHEAVVASRPRRQSAPPIRRAASGASRAARHAVSRATAAIAANPAQLESAVAQAIAADPVARGYVAGELSRSFPGFSARIASAAGGEYRVAGRPHEDTGHDRISADDGEVYDPLEGLNRVLFSVNEGLDFILLRPLAWTYNKLLPDPVILAIRRFFLNLGAPVVFANDLLQADFEDAGVTLGRFGVNSTVGLLGLLDVADAIGLHAHHADFGQTMHSYGAGPGAYLVLPLIGPSSVRDGFGLAVDVAMNPLTWLLPSEWNVGLTAGKIVVKREELLVPLDDLKAASLDYYTALKSAYQQHRQLELNKSIVDYSAQPSAASYDKLFDDLEDKQ